MSKHSLAWSSAALLALNSVLPTTTLAGPTVLEPLPPVDLAEDPFVSGTLSFEVHTHFISYGADIWGAGTKWRDALFQPSIELNFDLGGGYTGILGAWFDINDNADSDIGGSVQEVDFYIGLSKDFGPVNATLLYQEWLYASQSERIVDLVLGYDMVLNPSITLHGRVDGEGLKKGLVGVIGVAPELAAGAVTFSFPVDVAFATDEFHGGGSGFAYTSAGVGASVPLAFLKGDWSFNAGVTYYHTSSSVIPGNPDTDFVTGNVGVALSF